MAQEDTSLSQSKDMEELLDAFNELDDQYKQLKLTSKNLNQQNEELIKENNALVNEGKSLLFDNEELHIKNTELNMSVGHMKYKITNLEKDIKTLKDKSNDLLNTVVKFTMGKQNLDLLLSNQRASLHKHGIGFSPFQNTPYENRFIRETANEKYVFVVKKQNPSKRVQRDKYGKIIHKTGPTKIQVPKTLLSSNVGI